MTALVSFFSKINRSKNTLANVLFATAICAVFVLALSFVIIRHSNIETPAEHAQREAATFEQWVARSVSHAMVSQKLNTAFFKAAAYDTVVSGSCPSTDAAKELRVVEEAFTRVAPPGAIPVSVVPVYKGDFCFYGTTVTYAPPAK